MLTRVLTALLLASGVASAHAQTTPQYEHWSATNGGHGQVRTEGHTTDWDSYGPDGRVQHCHRYSVGEQPYTTCH